MQISEYQRWTQRRRAGKYEYQELFVGDSESILGSNYDGGKKTKILVHGYTDNGLESFYDWIENMVDAYLENGEILLWHNLLWPLAMTQI